MKIDPSLHQILLPTPLGDMLAIGLDNRLSGLWFVGQKHFPTNAQDCLQADSGDGFVAAVETWLADYFAWRCPTFRGELHPVGTPFQLAVWQVLTALPYGARATYKEVALRVAERLELDYCPVRATANAIGHNPISLIVPCHRVVGSDGQLHGYAGGLERKLALLNLEGQGAE
mgnify:FL=1